MLPFFTRRSKESPDNLIPVPTASLLAGGHERTLRPSVLVTGGAGFLGAHLCRTLLRQGYCVYAVDNFITGLRENVDDLVADKNFRLLELDITTSAFLTAMRRIPVTRIYHLACPTGVPNIDLLAHEMLMTCSVGTQNVLAIAQQHSAKLLFTSSCEIYGEPEVFPQTEEYNGNVSTTGPRSPYEEGKRFSETLVVSAVKHKSLDGRIVRIFNAYGPGMSRHDQRVLPQFLNALAAGQPLRIYGDGQQQRTFVFVDDLVAGLQLAMEEGVLGGIYNVGGDTPVTMKQLAEILFQVANQNPGISFQPHFTEDHTSRKPSLEKIRQLGWAQTVSLEDGLLRMLEAWGVTVAYPSLMSTDMLTVKQPEFVASVD